MIQEPRRYSLFAKPIAKSIEPLLKPIYKKHGFAEHRILTQWEQIVGQELASYSIPQKLIFRANTKEQGVLHILVSSARTLELQHMLPVILDRITTYFGYPAIERLKFIQTSGPLFRKERQKPSLKHTAPNKALTALLEECSDPELRTALLSLGIAVSQQNEL
jgi:hypothetical protein